MRDVAKLRKGKWKKCHWCRKSSYRTLIKCGACRKQFFCVDCIEERFVYFRVGFSWIELYAINCGKEILAAL